MARKKEPETIMDIRYRTLRFLESFGINTEKKLIAMSPEEIAELDGITSEQIRQVYRFRNAAKRREFYAYMTGALDQEKEQKQAGGSVVKEGGRISGSENNGSSMGDGGAQLEPAAGEAETGGSGAKYAGGSAEIYQNHAGEYGGQY